MGLLEKRKEQLARAYNNKGIALLDLERYEEAKDYFQLALDTYLDYKYYTNLGICLSELREDAKALDIFDIAIEGLKKEVEFESDYRTIGSFDLIIKNDSNSNTSSSNLLFNFDDI